MKALLFLIIGVATYIATACSSENNTAAKAPLPQPAQSVGEQGPNGLADSTQQEPPISAEQAFEGADASAHNFSDLLTIYVLGAPKPLNWKTPNSLVRSISANQYKVMTKDYTHSVGHVHVRLQCGLSTSTPFDKLTGMTSRGSVEDFRLLLMDQIGLGILFHDQFEGMLDDPDDAAEDIAARFARAEPGDAPGPIGFMRFGISPQTCQRMQTYLAEFSQTPNLRFGFPNRPRYREGSGCSAFAASFLEVGGLMRSEYTEQWKRQIEAPEVLIGDGKDNKINFFKILTRFKDEWASPNETSKRSLNIWDPDKILSWIESTHRSAQTDDFKPVRKGMGLGIEVDARSLATPTEPLFYN